MWAVHGNSHRLLTPTMPTAPVGRVTQSRNKAFSPITDTPNFIMAATILLTSIKCLVSATIVLILSKSLSYPLNNAFVSIVASNNITYHKQRYRMTNGKTNEKINFSIWWFQAVPSVTNGNKNSRIQRSRHLLHSKQVLSSPPQILR